jgi:hypothetical protein
VPYLRVLAEIVTLVEGRHFWTILAFLLGGRFTTRVFLLECMVYVNEFFATLLN